MGDEVQMKTLIKEYVEGKRYGGTSDKDRKDRPSTKRLAVGNDRQREKTQGDRGYIVGDFRFYGHQSCMKHQSSKRNLNSRYRLPTKLFGFE